MSKIKSRERLWLAVVGGVLAMGMGTPVLADSVAVNAGPIPLPSVPVTVCVNTKCEKTPSLGNLALGVSSSFANGSLTLPLITPGVCPFGQTGVALVVTVIVGSTTLSGTVTGTTAGMTYTKNLGPLVLNSLNRTATISACTG